MNTGTLSSRFLIKSLLTQEEAVRESDGKKLKTRAEDEADEMMGSQWKDSSSYYCVWCKLTASWPFVPAMSQDALACIHTHTLLHPDMPWTATSAAPSQSKHLQNVSALSSSSSLLHSYQLQIPAARLLAHTPAQRANCHSFLSCRQLPPNIVQRQGFWLMTCWLVLCCSTLSCSNHQT